MVAIIEPVPLTQSDFNLLKNIEPRKSVLNFSSEELSATSSWGNRFSVVLGRKSPFFRAINGEWRDKDYSYVPIIKVERQNSTYASVKRDIRKNVIYRSTPDDMPINIDTGWEIQTTRKGIEDTIKYAFKHNDSISLDMLYSLKELVENGVLLDSVISERNKANKAYNTAFMHRLYCICEIGGEHYLTNMAIEEFADSKGGTLKRLYNLQGIKTEPLRLIGLADNQLHPAVLNDSNISIANLFQFVKTFDKNFYTNVRDKVEIIPQTQDISHNLTNAALSAKRGESRGNTMAEHNTTFEVSSISKIENDSKVKALASVVINGEFAVRGIRVLEGEKGLFVAMPNKKYGDEYSDIAFPITAEARTALNNAVMNGYNQLMQSEEKTLKNEIPAAEQVNSSVKVSLKSIENYEHIKAAGQITIDNCFVVKDVKVIETEGKPPFVSMPSYQTNTGDYKEFAIPITKEMREKLNKSVLEKYQTLGKDKPKHDKQNESAKTAEKQKQNRTAKHKR